MESASERPTVLDLPPGWGNDVSEFRKKVLDLIAYHPLEFDSPKYDLDYPPGTNTPFYPVFCAMSPEWGEIVTRKEIREILIQKFSERARGAFQRATSNVADHVGHEEFLAWGIERGMFSPEEISRIRFDHGETPGDYVRIYGNPNLLEFHIDRLAHPSS